MAARGSVSIEVAILAPAFLGLMVVAAVLGRTAIADEAIGSAAHDAARAASIARTPGDAQTAATEAANAALGQAGLSCVTGSTVLFAGFVDNEKTSLYAAFSSPLGSNASVEVTVRCNVSYQDLSISALNVQSTRMRQATFVSPLDRYRSRTLTS
ncbi:TadE/TadG family type IV pilus assembly protein [Micromonospora sp. NPDC050397]|uniref:TadE/TadG family type IV pilus assembly protein n=1 Tax=Micromonospora sp. NPDC050397 TaxID=3364279 RepID=UPI00384D44FD